jgi:hypothetical protein
MEEVEAGEAEAEGEEGTVEIEEAIGERGRSRCASR